MERDREGQGVDDESLDEGGLPQEIQERLSSRRREAIDRPNRDPFEKFLHGVGSLLGQSQHSAVILASNLSKNMDQAFARRMHYVIEFPRPDAALREQLWRRVFPSQVPVAADVDFGFLGRQFDLAGGDIRTTALDAAFLAANQDRAVAMTDLVAAVSRQMLKQGRPLGASDFKQWHGSLADGVAS